MTTARETLDRLIRETGIGYAGASRLIGKNPAYIQQFIKRGTPRQLPEEDRHILARHFGVSEEELGAPALSREDDGDTPTISPHPGRHRFLDIPYIGENPHRSLGISAEQLPAIEADDGLVALRVTGDAMAPTLLHDDRLIVSTQDCAPLRDGLYLIWMNGNPVVKRIALHPKDGRVNIVSDNNAYPNFADYPSQGLDIIGRVVWVSRTLS